MTHKSLNNILPYDLVFFSKQAYFKVNVSDLDKTKLIKFKMFITYSCLRIFALSVLSICSLLE